SWGGWLRPKTEDGWGRQAKQSPRSDHLALPTRSLRDHPPHEGEGETQRLLPFDFLPGRKALRQAAGQTTAVADDGQLRAALRTSQGGDRRDGAAVDLHHQVVGTQSDAGRDAVALQ